MRFPHLENYIYPLNNLPPKASAHSETDNGTSINLGGPGGLFNQFHSGLAVCKAGAHTGTPASFAVVFKLQDSADGTTWTDVAGKTVTLDAENAIKTIDFFPNELREYIRMVRTTTISGGTSPRVPTDCDVLLGGGRTIPFRP